MINVVKQLRDGLKKTVADITVRMPPRGGYQKGRGALDSSLAKLNREIKRLDIVIKNVEARSLKTVMVLPVVETPEPEPEPVKAPPKARPKRRGRPRKKAE